MSEGLYGLDKELALKAKLKYDPEREEEARNFIRELSGLPIEGDFHEALKDGTALCTAMNRITQGTELKQIKISPSKMPFKQMENIGSFLDRMTLLGVPAYVRFQTVDLYENKNMNQVIDSMFALSRYASKLNPAVPLLGPKLSEKNVRTFTEEQLDKSRSAVPLLAGWTSKNSTGISMGGVRQVYNPDLGVGDTKVITKMMGGIQHEMNSTSSGVSFGGKRKIGGTYEKKGEESENVVQDIAQEVVKQVDVEPKFVKPVVIEQKIENVVAQSPIIEYANSPSNVKSPDLIGDYIHSYEVDDEDDEVAVVVISDSEDDEEIVPKSSGFSMEGLDSLLKELKQMEE